jgi:signal transduction histidine kinase
MKFMGDLEPGVLPTFRRFIGIQLAVTALVLTHWLVAPFPPRGPVLTLGVLSLLEPGLLFLYLSLPALPRTLKSFYLPLGIIWAAAAPLLDPHISLIRLEASGNHAPNIVAQVVLWRQIILLLILLVVVSWQYAMREVVIFCVLTTLLNTALLFRTAVSETSMLWSLLGIVLVQTIIFFLVGHMIVNLMKEQRQQRQRLTAANERLAQYASTLEQLTISRERNRLARELHDVLAHTMSGVAIELEGLRAIMRLDPERADTLLSHSLQAIRDGLTETRRALKELRAKPLEDIGLALAVRALAESYASRFGLEIQIEIDHNLGDYSAEVQQCVYRIAQEALANIGKHAQAQNAHVVLKRELNQLKLSICDDGCGFDSTLPLEEHHFGLLEMRERAETIGVSLVVESQVWHGTQVHFSYGGSQ